MIIIIVLILVIALGIGWWVYQDTQGYQASLDRLLKTGFEVDYTLPGQPTVVFDDDHKRLAFVSATRNTLYDYNQVSSWEWGSAPMQGWSNKSESKSSYYVVFHMQYPDEPTIKVEGLSENDQHVWRERLEKLLDRGPTRQFP